MDILPLESEEPSSFTTVSENEYSRGIRQSRVMSLPPGYSREARAKEVPDVLVTSMDAEGSREPVNRGVDSPDNHMKQGATGTGTADSLAQPIIMKGSLQKLGKIFKSWHQRYFEIQGTHMFYYKNSQKKDCFGAIDLSICFKSESTKAATFGHPFRLETTERVHTFSARSSEEMDQWLTAIQNTMGGPDALKQKRSKPKRWESLKNTFSIQPKSVTPSPEHSLPNAKKHKKTKKSLHNKLLRGGGIATRHSRSPSPNVEAEVPFHKRPMSFHGDKFPEENLKVLDDVTPSRSLPSTPVVKKRANTGPPPPPVSPSPGPSSHEQESDSTREELSRNATPVSIEVHEAEQEEEKKEEVEKKLEKPAKPLPPPRKRKTVTESQAGQQQSQPASLPPLPPPKPVRPVSPEVIVEHVHVTPEFLRRQFAWDEVREILETESESEVANSYDELPPEEASWLAQPSAIEQLRTFLAVCP